MHRVSVVAVVACACLVAGVGCGGSWRAARVEPLEEGATAVRLQATIYEVRVAPDQVAKLDAARLAKRDLSKHPRELGQSKALYVVDQKVSLAGDRVMVGTQEPVVTNSRIMADGKTVNQVQYMDVGAVVEFKADRTGPRQLQVTSTIELEALTDSPVEPLPGVGSPVSRKATMSLKGPVELGKPTVLISGDASARDKDGNAVVYVARLVLGAGA